MKQMSERQQMQIESERSMEVYKRNDMIQRARFTLSIQEQRTVLYAISKIKPTDTYLNEYIFDIKDFYALCGIEDQSYTRLKQMLTNLKSKTWWILLPDGETESCVAWFGKVRTNKKSGKVTIKFDEDMMPYLIQLAEQNTFYTKYNLQYVLPMNSQYSPRLYEILKSYQKNNIEWFFDIDELKRLLDCQNYKNFYDIKRWVLEPAVEEINKYTDLNIAYKTEKEGRRVARVIFGMTAKTKKELDNAEYTIRERLDGQMDIFDFQEQRKQAENDPVMQLFKDHAEAVRKERETEAIGREKLDFYKK